MRCNLTFGMYRARIHSLFIFSSSDILLFIGGSISGHLILYKNNESFQYSCMRNRNFNNSMNAWLATQNSVLFADEHSNWIIFSTG